MAVLITGGAGYIGSHTCVELLEAGEKIVVMDNLSNSSRNVIDTIKKITARDFPFYEADILDSDALDRIFSENGIDSVIHFAGLKSVAESVREPLKYHRNNVIGTQTLCEAMLRHNCKTIVFSSSATVYGVPEKVPVTEDCQTAPTNPYGKTKLEAEEILRRLHDEDNEWKIAVLRYFNPIGAHASGLIGEKPTGIPNNLMPYVCLVAAGKLDEVRVFGNDYPTPDGTGVRDYVHISDLAKAHLCAMRKLREGTDFGVWNIGTGKGYSVLEIIKAFERVNKIAVPYSIAERRDGDVAECYADPSKAYRELGWKAEKSIDEMCADCWNFSKNNKLF